MPVNSVPLIIIADFADPNVSWPNATINARGAVTCKNRDGAASADEVVCYLDFGTNFSTTTDSFRVRLPRQQPILPGPNKLTLLGRMEMS